MSAKCQSDISQYHRHVRLELAEREREDWQSSLIEEIISGQTTARASRPIKIPRCCKHTPLCRGTSKMRMSLVGMASVNGLTETLGATLRQH